MLNYKGIVSSRLLSEPCHWLLAVACVRDIASLTETLTLTIGSSCNIAYDFFQIENTINFSCLRVGFCQWWGHNWRHVKIRDHSYWPVLEVRDRRVSSLCAWEWQSCWGKTSWTQENWVVGMMNYQSINKERKGWNENLPHKFPEHRPCTSTFSNCSTHVARTWTMCMSLSTAFSVLNECSTLRWIRWRIQWWWMGWARYWRSVNRLKPLILPCIASRRVTSSSSSEPNTYCWLSSMCSGSKMCWVAVCVRCQDISSG